jgi:hypothetical protein
MGITLIIRNVTGPSPSNVNPEEQRVVFTVHPDLDELQHIPRGCTFNVERILRSRPEDRFSSLDRLLDGLAIDVGDHQHLPRIYFLDGNGEHLGCESGD